MRTIDHVSAFAPVERLMQMKGEEETVGARSGSGALLERS